jgi:flagellar biosynthesis protein FlhG
MKVLFLQYSANHFKLLVNSAKNAQEARDVFNNLSLVAQKFLNLSIDYWGYIPRDENIVKAVRMQKALIELYPDSPASKCFFNLAEKVCKNQPNTESRGNIRFFWSQILENPESLPLRV